MDVIKGESVAAATAASICPLRCEGEKIVVGLGRSSLARDGGSCGGEGGGGYGRRVNAVGGGCDA